MISCEQLIQQVLTYNKKSNTKLIERAYNLCILKHGKQIRKSGEPYYTHPIAVAQMIANIMLDDNTIVTALLHDTIEDTDLNYHDIREMFSPKIADLVEGVTKLDRIKLQPDKLKQAENFRKLFLALSKDIRVLIVKLCDRLHNLQTIEFQAKSKKKQIAIETLEVYAPLADQVGMKKIKEEMQDLCFSILNSRARTSVIKQLQNVRNQYNKINNVDNIIESIEDELLLTLKKHGLEVEVHGREKKPYSIWVKLIKKQLSFDQLSDIVAFRVITNTINDCYMALSVIHQTYHAVPGLFVDHISSAKINNYRSIHTTIFGPYKQKVEIQIRTKDMHADAEYGIAAHWRYKQGFQDKKFGEYTKSVLWIQKIMEIMNDTDNAEEFLENAKLEMYDRDIFLFTTQGNIITLPEGASVIDAAFTIDTDLGMMCDGAKIDNKIYDIDFAVQNGMRIEILTSKNQWPRLEWLKFAKTGRARAAIKKATHGEKIEQEKIRGRAMLEKLLLSQNKKIDQFTINKLSERTNKSIDQIYYEIGSGMLDIVETMRSIFPSSTNKTKQSKRKNQQSKPELPTLNQPIMLNNFYLPSNVKCVLSQCCYINAYSDNLIGVMLPAVGLMLYSERCRHIHNRYLDESFCKINIQNKTINNR